MKEIYQKIYSTLDEVTPLKTDCGLLCNKACCDSLTGTMGMYLLPNENLMFDDDANWLTWDKQDPEEFCFPYSFKEPVYFINCIKPCPRDKRPLQCRTFPLAPYLDGDGILYMIKENIELPYQCPLLEPQVELEADFIEKVFLAWSELIQYPLIYDLVEYDSQDREQPITIVYPKVAKA
jgi:hypothetical protein